MKFFYFCFFFLSVVNFQRCDSIRCYVGNEAGGLHEDGFLSCLSSASYVSREETYLGISEHLDMGDENCSLKHKDGDMLYTCICDTNDCNDPKKNPISF